MKKQTAVEWVLNELRTKMGYGNNLGRTAQIIFDVITCEAKAMEKEQIEDAVSNGISKADMVDNRGYFNFDKWYNETYEANNYDAWDEVIDQLGETNEMIDHIGEVNEMVNHVPDVGKMVEDDVVKLAEEYAIKVYHAFEDATWFRPLNLGYYAGYTKAKETLYTEEQVREAIRYVVERVSYDSQFENKIIQSLKK